MCTETEFVDQSARISAIRVQVEELRTEVTFLDGSEASTLLTDVTSLTSELEALRLHLVSRIESTEVWRDDPNGTANSWLRANHRVDHRGAKADLNAARALQAYPSLGAAAEAGELSRAHVDVIVAIGEANRNRRRLLSEFMDSFVEVGRHAPPSVLRTVMRAWADQVDPLGTARDEHEAHSRRYLHVNQLADGVQLDAFFGHEQGAKVLAALNAALTKSRRGRDVEGQVSGGIPSSESGGRASGSVPGTVPGDEAASMNVPGNVLSTAQQRADAFIAGIIDPALTGDGLPSVGGARPSVTVLVPLGRLEQPCDVAVRPHVSKGLPSPRPWSRESGPPDSEAAASAEVGRLSPAERLSRAERLSPAGQLVGSAQLGVNNGPGQVLISAEAAQRMTCDCEVHRIVLSPEGLPLDVGRTMRTFPSHMRRALIVRDGGCVFPGCDRPPGWTEAHHIVHWAQGGRTAIENAALLCSKHHHKVHAEGHVVEIGPDGRARVLVTQLRPGQVAPSLNRLRR